jgi:hypothetical protein
MKKTAADRIAKRVDDARLLGEQARVIWDAANLKPLRSRLIEAGAENQRWIMVPLEFVEKAIERAEDEDEEFGSWYIYLALEEMGILAPPHGRGTVETGRKWRLEE